MFDVLTYQLALRTPGMCPRSASSRKQIRHSPNFRRNALERPHRQHRLTARTLNLGLRLARWSQLAFAILTP